MGSSDDYRDRPVRPYVITSGRAHPSRNTIRPETLLIANPEAKLPIMASREQRAILDVCRGMLSLAEVAAHLDLPVSVVVVLASDLVDTGHLVLRSAPQRHVLPDREILEKVLNGLRKL
ncbi:Protein of unknown function (DUF742) [Saccharomonospora marina XMU15]|uniref:DUF742 domain-containing protein n=1 Tax=Saccharomonospora marina XMU15 TaxID=882083 RepID=H5WZS4_9PSEU|nr:DUF742 domain-containing protein [Saccharomonospora marina]EHR51861.1 Protein of unknown function (DUF742) [Saccharomonospora marina XMU15]